MQEQDVRKEKARKQSLGEWEAGEVPYLTFILVAYRDEKGGLRNGPSGFCRVLLLETWI